MTATFSIDSKALGPKLLSLSALALLSKHVTQGESGHMSGPNQSSAAGTQVAGPVRPASTPYPSRSSVQLRPQVHAGDAELALSLLTDSGAMRAYGSVGAQLDQNSTVY